MKKCFFKSCWVCKCAIKRCQRSPAGHCHWFPRGDKCTGLQNAWAKFHSDSAIFPARASKFLFGALVISRVSHGHLTNLCACTEGHNHFHTISSVMRRSDDYKYSVNNHCIARGDFSYSSLFWGFNRLQKKNYDNMGIGNLFLILAQVASVSDATPSKRFSPKTFVSNFRMILPSQWHCLTLMR